MKNILMNFISRWIAAFVIELAIYPTAFAQPVASPVAVPAWPVPSAPARIIIEPEEYGPKSIASTELYLPDPKWATMPFHVFTEQGIPVGSSLLWTAPGEPVTLLFDSSAGARHYHVYVGSNSPAKPLGDAKGGVLLEARKGDGTSINHLNDMLRAWNQSQTVLGRTLVAGIFEGGNRFGPQDNFFEHFQGWFDVTASENLQIALMSAGASFVLVDGKEVVEWPGIHDRWYKASDGPPRGAIDLPAGPHCLECYYAYVSSDGAVPAACYVAVKGGPIDQWTMLTSDNTFIRPVAHDHPVRYELRPNLPGNPPGAVAPALAMTWTNVEQSVINTDLPDIGLVALQLSCLDPVTGTVLWTFDDGSTAQGQRVKHLFLRPGIRTVHVDLMNGAKRVASLDQTINVHFDWVHLAWLDSKIYPEQESDVLSRDPTAMSVSDLVSCFGLFGNYMKTDELLKLLPAVCAKINQVTEHDLPYLKDAALVLVRDDWAHPTEETQLLRALIERSASVTEPKPATVAVASECRLALARLILNATDHTDEVRALISAINLPSLVGDEPRAMRVLKADLALVSGDLAGAKAQYQTLSSAPSDLDVRSSIRATAAISQARAFIDRKDFDAAEDTLNDVVWQFPLEKISPEWALVRLRLYQEENHTAEGFLWAKRLLPVLTDGGRSELLFRIAELAFAQGDVNLAHKALAELLTKHPYSQEAAEAKEKWPGQSG